MYYNCKKDFLRIIYRLQNVSKAKYRAKKPACCFDSYFAFDNFFTLQLKFKKSNLLVVEEIKFIIPDLSPISEQKVQKRRDFL